MEELIPNLRDERVQGAVKSLLIYSLTIIAVPLGSMFFVKYYLFEGNPIDWLITLKLLRSGYEYK